MILEVESNRIVYYLINVFNQLKFQKNNFFFLRACKNKNSIIYFLNKCSSIFFKPTSFWHVIASPFYLNTCLWPNKTPSCLK